MPGKITFPRSLLLLICFVLGQSFSSYSLAGDLLYRHSSLQRAIVPGLVLTPTGEQIDIRAIKQRLGLLSFNAGDTVVINTDTLAFQIFPNQAPYQVLSQNPRFSQLDLAEDLAAILPNEEIFTVGTSINEINAEGTTLFAGKFNFRLLVNSSNNTDELGDFDDDGVPDGDDNCPNLPNTNQVDSDGDDIGDVCDEDTLGNEDVAIAYEDISSNPLPFSNTSQSCSGDTPLRRSVLVTEQFNVSELVVGFTVEHVYRGDVQMTLESPLGTRVQLLNSDSTGGSANYDIYFDDSSVKPADDGDDDNVAAPFYERDVSPANLLSTFNGEPAQGEWIVEVCDAAADAAGAYYGSKLIFRTGVDVDDDGTDNDNDCALLDETRFQNLNGFADNDDDGLGSGAALSICSGAALPSGFVIEDGDNCPDTPNQDQVNTDGDNEGDACDADADNDGVLGFEDIDSLNPLICLDSDNDLCDDCSIGVDGFGELADNTPNNDGPDNDNDGLCDAGDPDIDGDGIPNDEDNCPLDANTTQEDICTDQQDDEFCLPISTGGSIVVICL